MIPFNVPPYVGVEENMLKKQSVTTKSAEMESLQENVQHGLKKKQNLRRFC